MGFKRDHLSEAIKIPLSSIALVEAVHLRGNPNYQYKHKSPEDCLVVVRQATNGYVLVSGWADYQECLNEGYETVNAIVTNHTCGEFMRKFSHTYVPIERIVIPPHMEKSTPREWKLERVRKRLGTKNRLDKPITVDRDYVLLDGYTRYLVAKEIKLKYVPIIWCN